MDLRSPFACEHSASGAQEQPRGSSISNLVGCTVTPGYEDFFTSGKWCVGLALQG